MHTTLQGGFGTVRLLMAAAGLSACLGVSVASWQIAAPRDDSARAVLEAIARRFGDTGAVAEVDVRVEKSGRRPEDFRLEAWSRSAPGSETLAIFLLAPELRRGTAFRFDRSEKGGRPVEVRHLYLPSKDQLAEIRGLKRMRLERELSGVLGVTLFELGDDFQAEDLGESRAGDIRTRKVRVTGADGAKFEAWIEDQGAPFIRQMRHLGGDGRQTVQVLEITETIPLEGLAVEAAGIMSGAGKPTTRFRIRSLRRPSAAERAVFTREGFGSRARAIARGSATGTSQR